MRKAVDAKKKERLKKGEVYKWIPFSEVVNLPLALPMLMVTGPRWNCHAVLANVGPFKVDAFIEIKISAAHESAGMWSLVIYNEQYQTVAHLSSAELKNKERQKINLIKGEYLFCIRLYNSKHRITFPEILVDGNNKVSKRIVKNENAYYQSYLSKIQNNKEFIYYFLHYYVYYLLIWEKWLPLSFVSKEYLPVGNPDTSFKYGYLKKGEILQVDLESGLLEDANIYIAFYNMCSFPVFWHTIQKSHFISDCAPCNGHYLIRIQSHIKNILSKDLTTKVHCIKFDSDKASSFGVKPKVYKKIQT